MNLDSFDYAAALAREHNFTRAARQLGITQQSLSAHIAGLEAELGCQLFRRGGALEITQAGAVFLCHAENVRREVETLRREVGDAVQNQRGVLRIGVAFTRGRAIMPELIARFQAQYPGVSVELFEAANQALQYDLQNKKIDLALANFPAAVPGVELCDFYREEVVLLLPKSLTPESGGKDKAAAQSRKTQAGRGDLSALAGCPFVLGGADNIAGRIGRSLIENAGFAPLVRAKSDNMETLLSLCVQGVGACFCPENLAKAVLSPAELARVQVLRLGAAAPVSHPLWLAEIELSLGDRVGIHSHCNRLRNPGAVSRGESNKHLNQRQTKKEQQKTVRELSRTVFCWLFFFAS